MTYAVASPHPRNADLSRRVEARLQVPLLLIRDREALDPRTLSDANVEIIFFPHWSWKIPPAVHEHFECIIFHMTDVPFGRGGSPLQNLIIRGFTETRISALRCVDDLDAGPVYLKRSLSLGGTAEEILLRADRVIEDMIVEIATSQPEARPQVGEVTHFARRRPKDGDISAISDLQRVHDVIRMLDADGYPPAFIDIGDLRLEFSRSSLRLGEVVADVRIRVRPNEETR